MSDASDVQRDDGGPALPVNEKNDDGTHFVTHKGLSLRDYFAAHALASLDPHSFECFAHMAFDAYSLADAMLAARKGTPS